MANFHYRLLIIDDEPLSRELLQSSLSEQGYEVRIAKDGFAALAQMQGALPDLIVTDLKMPNMSGFEFLSIARRRFPQIPTIAISGEFDPPVKPLGVLADAFFAKPFRFEELRAKITELLREGPPRPAIKRDQAPVWVPRNGEYYVITCTDCLRSFSIPAEKSVRLLRELRTLECIFCEAQVQFIIEEMPEAAGLPMIKKDSHRMK
ncbi:MAG TPA: response regulator [Chthoniobacterales bacterium]|nr:response regulator [Chthoniobacterales bacterium]